MFHCVNTKMEQVDFGRWKCSSGIWAPVPQRVLLLGDLGLWAPAHPAGDPALGQGKVASEEKQSRNVLESCLTMEDSSWKGLSQSARGYLRL